MLELKIFEHVILNSLILSTTLPSNSNSTFVTKTSPE